MSKQFGLIIPGKQKKQPERPPHPPTKPSIFDESSNSSVSDNDAGGPQKRLTGKAGVVSGPSLMERRVAKNIQMKALAEDPTIFQYDELYDDMDNKREAAKETKKLEPRKAKYIGRLLEHAERRKLENELRVERQVQKDREAEGEMYKDKDTYVTAAYRKKLESIRQMQEQDARDDYLESIGDVTKQKDLDGFYRHLYEQKLGTQQEVIKPKTAPSTEDVAYKPIKREGQISSSTKQRIYRRQRSSLDDNDDTTAIATTPTADSKTGAVKAHLANNIDADSDFSIDDSSDEDEPATAKAVADSNAEDQSKPAAEVADKEKQPTLEAETKPQQEQSQPTEQSTDNSIKEPDVETVVRKPIDRSYIWRKRTVGEAFDNALARYHERKLARRA
ncbi:PREDICTED: nuclear speckle splicing regulatory protein 1 [Drosophila arizonae]|uniref:Nuclear speckle splicing regulatory protein 1 n=1 Tax=Drosophila arizonae TaxID=7263 RepID=A0ABM1PUN0_DROAR|nr:PREDICTED: nuclear speckle splicing regulatory protein 1 [Drosophila arizonae]